MSSLVAYYGSGSSGSEDEEDEPASIGTKAVNRGSSKVEVEAANSSATTPGSKTTKIQSSAFSRFIDNEEEGEDVKSKDELEESENPVWSKFLPQPKTTATVQDIETEGFEEIGPIPPKKTYGDEESLPPKPSAIPSLSATMVQGKVRISIPFLNSLQEDDTSDDDNKRKFVEPSKKGSGLFAVLPQPKNSISFATSSDTKVFLNKAKVPSKSIDSARDTSGSNESTQPGSSHTATSTNKLIPDAVKNRLKRPSQSKLDEIRAKLIKKGGPIKKQNDSDDSDNDDGDFFSLDHSETVDLEALEKLKLPVPNFDKPPEPQVYENMEVEDQEYEQVASSSRSDDLMRFMKSKKGKKEDVKFIDINADDLRPDNTEWLKNMTDERAIPSRQSKGLGGMVKRKHQITYLAFEAKAREQDLKNQWAENRANKNATRNKYGF